MNNKRVQDLEEVRLPLFVSVLFFMMLVLPTVYQPIKLALLVVALATVLLGKRIDWPPEYVIAALGISAFGCLQILHALWLDTPGATSVWTVFVLWPLVFMTMALAITSHRQLLSLFRVLLVASWTIGILGLLVTLSALGMVPRLPLLDLVEIGEGAYVEGGVVAFDLYSLSSVIFLFPFLLALSMTWPRVEKPPLPWWTIYAGIVLLAALVLMSGRRALFVNLLAFPLLLLFFALLGRTVVRRWLRLFAVGTTCAVILPVILGINLAATRDYLLSGNVKSESSRIRVVQYHQLVDAWRAGNEFFGSGVGAVAPGPLRSIETPWAYELAYLALLFQIGLLGVLVYGFLIGSVYWRLGTVTTRAPEVGKWAAPMFVGGTSFLLANATNPYLLKFDYFWVMFLPVAIVRLSSRASGNTQLSVPGEVAGSDPDPRVSRES